MTDMSLRPIRTDDLDTFFEWMRDPDAVHMAAFTTEDPADRNAFDAHWHHILRSPEIVCRTVLDTDILVGHICVFPVEGDLEITYWIDRARWAQGIASTAVHRMLADVEHRRPLHARAAADNVASHHVLVRNGFVEIGRGAAHANGRGEVTEEIIYVLNNRPVK